MQARICRYVTESHRSPYSKIYTGFVVRNGGRLKGRPGIPLAHRGYEAGRVTTEMQVTSVRAVSLPPATFDVPAGYQLKVVNMGGGE